MKLRSRYSTLLRHGANIHRMHMYRFRCSKSSYRPCPCKEAAIAIGSVPSRRSSCLWMTITGRRYTLCCEGTVYQSTSGSVIAKMGSKCGKLLDYCTMVCMEASSVLNYSKCFAIKTWSLEHHIARMMLYFDLFQNLALALRS